MAIIGLLFLFQKHYKYKNRLVDEVDGDYHGFQELESKDKLAELN